MKKIIQTLSPLLAVIMLIVFTSSGVQLNPGLEEMCNPRDTLRIELENTHFKDMSLLFISDTAASTQAIGVVLGKAYGELMKFANSNRLQPKKFIAWYYSVQPPWPMDIAVEINIIPPQLNGRIQTRILKGGEVLIAHMWGPYDQISQAYSKIQTWMKDNNRKEKGKPFEVYLNDPSAVKSPNEIRTDVYQLVE